MDNVKKVFARVLKTVGRSDIKPPNELDREEDFDADHKEAFAPNTRIPYKPDLIKSFVKEHRALVTMNASIIAFVEIGNQKKAWQSLEEYKELFWSHLMKKNTSFYLYVEHTVTDPSALRSISKFKVDTTELGRIFREFFAKYPEGAHLDNDFATGFKKIGGLFIKRIRAEEQSLYITYQPVRQYRPASNA